MRGGAADRIDRADSLPGRSPHARGSPHPKARRIERRGSIPACAGEPRGLAAVPSDYGVDPRMRGGAPPLARTIPLSLGRSPHARGSLRQRQCVRPALGSIPACAGEPYARNGFGWG